ncbi:NXPE family member 3-like [Saccoglossus kowalevskii]|uniref:NXPE family member 3-like n=1 Tax=Saccoglossus kowalevskii TaxID=10224 RepID=A0ABM0GNF1_SACKO|nr:PREDICTED: NXPE family member 3-like [Saccoglossus kowalevskii]
MFITKYISVRLFIGFIIGFGTDRLFTELIGHMPETSFVMRRVNVSHSAPEHPGIRKVATDNVPNSIETVMRNEENVVQTKNPISSDDEKQTMKDAKSVNPTNRTFRPVPSPEKNGNKNTISQNNELMFPYDKYTRFGLEWKGILEEYEYVYSNLKTEEKKSSVPFILGKENFWMSSTEKSRAYFYENQKHFKKGDHIHVVVETYDKYDNRRNKGGDMFQAVMSNTQLQKSTAGRVYDYGNGTYSIYFYAAWSGDAKISVYLLFTRELILYFNSERLKEQRVPWTGHYGDGVKTETTACSLLREGVWADKCTYGNENSLGGTVFICDKPKSFSCQQLVNATSGIAVLVQVAEQEKQNIAYLFKGKEQTRLACTPLAIKIADSSFKLPSLPPCGPDLPIPISDGYWSDNNTYVSLVCKSQQWTPVQIRKCLSNVAIRLCGDSTIGQIRQRLSWVHNHTDIITGNGFFSVGPNPVYFWNFTFESEFLDSITTENCASKKYVIMMNIMFHYASWSLRSYIDRLFVTKFAVQRFLKRCPTAVVIFKSAHTRDNVNAIQVLHSSNWAFYDMDRMIRSVFSGIGVHFLGVWDMCLSHFSKPDVHMAKNVIEQEIQLMFSYICPELVEG